MALFIYFIFLLILFIAELAYFKIADRYNIIDKPNHRSSHTQITIRGGGIVFPLSVVLWFVFSGFQCPFFICGLLLISVISFIDDIKDISRSVRMLIHVIAVTLILSQLHLFAIDWIWIVLGYILIIGIINACNFMDGINGITGIYSTVLMGTLLWINQYQVKFIDNSLLIAILSGLLVFNFFNCRKKAACFAGDIGSISMAFIICFLLAKLIIQTSQICYVLMLSVYGIDAIFTIIKRLSKKENIFLAHRQHLYQIMANQAKYPHLSIAILYGTTQLFVNIIMIIVISKSVYIYLPLVVIILTCLYSTGRLKFESLKESS